MGDYLFLTGVILVPAICARLLAGRRHAFHLAGLMCIAGTAFLLVLLIVNDAAPFTGGGDDEDYYHASRGSFTSWGDWFDTTRYESHEQAGYPLLLSWVHQVSGDSLFHLKALNVLLLLAIALVWFAIGNAIGGQRLAFIYAYGVLLATPLWYYFLFLLKDMTITLLQSIFVLGLVLFISSEHRLRGSAVIALSTLAVIPFRSMLAAFNVALLVACTLFQRRSGGIGTRLTLVVSLVAGLWLLSAQPGLMESLGARGEDRLLTAEGIAGQAERAGMEGQPFARNPLIFPVLFLVGETDALNPATWGQFDLADLRALSMVPWIFLGLPFFFAGIVLILRRTRAWSIFASRRRHDDGRGAGEDLRRRQTRALLVLLGFIVAYAALGWFSGTTVRWTLPAIPPMVGIAGFAWASMIASERMRLLIAFDLSFLALIFIYYLALK